jgi:hypothetical protein
MKGDPVARERSAKCRDRLLSFLQAQGARLPDDNCAICLEPLNMCQPSTEGKELLILVCMHCFHEGCFGKYRTRLLSEDEAQVVPCPTCRQPVLLYG